MLRFRDVTVRYGSGAGAVAALHGFDVSIGRGEVVGLVGPSGAGKSTILRLAAGLVLPTAGSVEVLGVDTTLLGRRGQRPVRARVGSVHQAFALVGSLRVAHNVAAGRLGHWGWFRAIRSLVRPGDLDEVRTALDRVGIADKLWERADRLSGGQQQRTAIARVLHQHPDLYLADEPCSALDPARADAVLSVLTEEIRSPHTAAGGDGRALVASLHDAPLALRHCDRIVGLRSGELVFDLPASDVTSDHLARLYALEDGALDRGALEGRALGDRALERRALDDGALEDGAGGPGL